MHVQASGGNSLAVFVWFGYNGTVDHPNVYRSDSGAGLCQASSFSPISTVGASIDSANHNIVINDGSTPARQVCGFPSPGLLSLSPTPLAFGSITPASSLTKTVTLTNRGGDCIQVSGISSSSPFGPSGFTPFSVAVNKSVNQSVQFVPAGASGSFSKTLAFTTSPVTALSLPVAGSSCSNLGTVNSCGSCGHVCPVVPNGTPMCAANGTCAIGSCNSGFSLCGTSCVPESSDVNNCGSCGHVCPAVANANPVCSLSKCGFQCSPGYILCGGICLAQPSTAASSCLGSLMAPIQSILE
jgi:hypothetical protein